MQLLPKNSALLLAVIAVVSLLQACGPSRFVKPLAKNEKAVAVSAGGPLIEFSGSTIPVPLTSIAYGHGVDSNITVFAGWHPTAALFNNLQLDIGATYSLATQKGNLPGLTVSPVMNIVRDLDEKLGRVWPQFDINTYWELGENKHLLYLGLSSWFELRLQRSHEQNQIQRWIPSPMVGYTHRVKKTDFNLEFKFIAPAADNRYTFVPYKSVFGDTGATGIYLSAVRRF